VRTSTSVVLTWNLAANNATNLNNDVNAFLITKTISGRPVEEIRIPRVTSAANGHTWTDEDLSPGITASYRIQALWNAVIETETDTDTGEVTTTVTGGRAGLRSAVRNVTTPGGTAPSTVRGTVNSPTQMTVTWNAVTAAVTGARLVGYDVNLFLNNTVIATEYVLIEAPRSSIFTDLLPNVQYSVRVNGVWDFGTVNEPDERPGLARAVNVRMSGPAPATPAIVAGSLTGTSVSLRWTPVNNPGVIGYRIVRETPSLPVAERTQTFNITKAEYMSNGNTWTDTGLNPGVPVRYRVQALWDIADVTGIENMPGGIFSAWRSVSPPGAAPGSVRGTVSPTGLVVTWNAVSANVVGSTLTGYRVDVWTRTAPIDVVASAVVNDINNRRVEFTDDLYPRTNYQIRVTPLWAPSNDISAVRDGRVSANVNVTTTGVAPGGFRASNLWTTLTPDGWTSEVQLTWNVIAGAAGNGVRGYRIVRSIAGIPDEVVFISANDFFNEDNTWTDTDLTPGILVRYTVQAIWHWDDSWSDMDGLEAATVTNSKPGTATARISVTPPSP